MQNDEFKIPQNGLKPLERDSRDFSLGAISSNLKKEDIPEEDFVIAWPIKIKFQDDAREDFCTGMASAAVSEDQEEEEMSGEYQFAKIKQVMGEFGSWGADLRSAVKALTTYGSLPQNVAAKYIKDKFGDSPTRDQMANWENWDSDLDTIASFHRKASFFEVDGPFDAFDNIRARLWQHRNEKDSVICGVEWHPEWTIAPGGVIKQIHTSQGYGHAFKVFGQKRIEGIMYLRAQLSNGEKIGDKGVFYFSREVINLGVAKYGLFMVKDIQRADAEQMIKTGVKLKDNVFERLWKIIIFIFK